MFGIFARKNDLNDESTIIIYKQLQITFLSIDLLINCFSSKRKQTK